MSSPVTIQPSTADVDLEYGAPASNYGAATTFVVRPASTTRKHALVSFDFSASIPSGAIITLATLSLYATAVATGRTIGCYRLRRGDWVESQATWNNYKTSTAWGTGGALNTTTDHDTTDGATSASLSAAGWQKWTVTAQVQYARDSVAGVAHFFLRDTGATATAQQTYCSRRYTINTSLRPKLYIEYTVPGGIPTGASFLLRMI